jgi:hypothetical protein
LLARFACGLETSIKPLLEIIPFFDLRQFLIGLLGNNDSRDVGLVLSARIHARSTYKSRGMRRMGFGSSEIRSLA